MQIAVAPWLIPFSVAAVMWISFVDYNPGAGRPVFGKSPSETPRHAAHRLANVAVEVHHGSEMAQTALAAGREKYHQAKGQACAITGLYAHARLLPSSTGMVAIRAFM